MINKNSPIWNDLFVILVLLISGFKYTYGLESFIDISVNDESHYLYRGINFWSWSSATGTVAAKTPVYAFWYYLLSLWQPDSVELYYLNYKLLTVLLPILLYILLRRYRVTVLSSLTISFFFLLSYANICVWTRVSHFSISLILTALILASCSKSRIARLAIVCSGALLSSYVRPEMFLAFIPLFILCIIMFVLEPKENLFKETMVLLGMFSLSLLMISIYGLPVLGDRSFGAFGQHFSLNWIDWTNNHSMSPWTNWKKIVSINFGNVQSVFEAFSSNPILFFKHIACNLVNALRIFKMFFYHANLFVPIKFGKSIEFYLLVVLFILYVILSRNRWMPTLRSNIKENKQWLMIFACFLTPMFISIVVIYPKQHYMIPLGLLTTIITALFICNRKHVLSSVAYKWLIPLGFLLVCLAPSSSYLLGDAKNRDNVETIMLIRSLNIREKVNLLEAIGRIYIHLGGNYHRVAEFYKNTNFNNFLEVQNINMIIVSDELIENTRFRNDTEWKYFLDNYMSKGYRKIKIPNTDRLLIVNRGL